MRRVLVVTWALGTACGVLLGLFGVQIVSSRFSTSRVSPLSHPEVLRALQAARHVPNAPDEVALPAPAPDTAVPPPSPPTDAAPARPSAGATSSPADASPAGSLPRPGATAGTLVDPAASAAATPPSPTSTNPPEPPSTSTSATTATTEKKKSDSKGSGRSSTTSSSTTTTTDRKTTTTSAPAPQTSRQPSPTTITCTGGIVTVRYSGGKVELKAARPNSGYQVYVPEQQNPGEVVVYFYNKNTAYQVRAFYNYGSPDYKVTKYQWADRGGQTQGR